MTNIVSDKILSSLIITGLDEITLKLLLMKKILSAVKFVENVVRYK